MNTGLQIVVRPTRRDYRMFNVNSVQVIP